MVAVKIFFLHGVLNLLYSVMFMYMYTAISLTYSQVRGLSD